VTIAAPKIELHCHLDGSVRISTVAAIGRELGLRLPEPLEPALVAPAACADLADYLRRIVVALEVMQHPKDLERIARELVEDWAADGVIYGEVRFAPQLHTRRGLPVEQVLGAVHRGLTAGSAEHGVGFGLILCCLRQEPPARSLEIARLAADNRDKVCALDLAGDEARFPGAPHAPAFALAREAGLRRTAHAGEAAGAGSIREALDALGAERIGHGVRIEEDPQLAEGVRSRAIPLEMCPTSNVQTRAAASAAAHPIDRLLRRGLRVTVSTDSRTVSATTVTGEFRSLTGQWGWAEREFLLCQRHAAEAAFVSPDVRRKLLARIERAAESSPPADSSA